MTIKTWYDFGLSGHMTWLPLAIWLRDQVLNQKSSSYNQLGTMVFSNDIVYFLFIFYELKMSASQVIPKKPNKRN